MRKILSIVISVVLSLAVTAQENNMHDLYVGTFTSEGAEGIYHCRFDEGTGKITLTNIFKGVDNPSFLEFSPDRNFLYAVTRPSDKVESSGGYVHAYKTGPGGKLIFLNKQSANGMDPCHIDVSPDGKFAAVATYGGGTVSLYTIGVDGRLEEARSTVLGKGSGPDKNRQQGPHAHSVIFSDDSKTLFSADLGTDRLNIYPVTENKLDTTRHSFLKLAPGAGPRHFRLHPDGTALYVINELNSTITAFHKKGESWHEIQTLSSVPEGFEEKNYCADIHVAEDGRYLYGSNRGHNSIAVYTIDNESKRLEWITAVPVQGDWPRNFTLSPGGRFLLAANQKSGNISVFKINADTGIPEFTGNQINLPSPVCLLFR